MRNLSLIFAATITLFFASCSKPVDVSNGNENGNTVETKTDMLTNGVWTMIQNDAQGNLIIEDKINFHKNSKGNRVTKMVIGSLQTKEYTYTWNFANNQKDIHMTQTLVRLNGSTNIDPSEAYPELHKYRIVHMTTNTMNLKRILPDGSLLPTAEAYTK